MKTSTAAKASTTAMAPERMVSSPRVAPMVASATGRCFRVAGSRPALRMVTSVSTSRALAMLVIEPSVRMGDWMRGADMIWLSSTMARWR